MRKKKLEVKGTLNKHEAKKVVRPDGIPIEVRRCFVTIGVT